MDREDTKIPIKRVLFLTFCSLLVTTILFFCGFMSSRYFTRKKAHDPQYVIRSIVPRCHSTQCLQTKHLLEMLGLSQDRLVNRYAIKKSILLKKLYDWPVIKHAYVTFLDPAVVVVDYTLREPIAVIGNIENGAVDEERRLLPLTPYFSSDNLPEIILGNFDASQEFSWGRPLVGGSIDQALEVLHEWKQRYRVSGMRLLSIDVEKADSLSADREIVLHLACDRDYFVRLNAEEWKRGIELFFFLYPVHIESAVGLTKQKQAEKQADVLPCVVVDLRLPSLVLVR